jgi:hypothetical protein
MTNRKKPEFRGSFIGQIIYSEKLVRTGKSFFKEDKEGNTMRFPIREKRGITHWVWNGEDWIRGDIWEADMARRRKKGFKKPPGMLLK